MKPGLGNLDWILFGMFFENFEGRLAAIEQSKKESLNKVGRACQKEKREILFKGDSFCIYSRSKRDRLPSTSKQKGHSRLSLELFEDQNGQCPKLNLSLFIIKESLLKLKNKLGSNCQDIPKGDSFQQKMQAKGH